MRERREREFDKVKDNVYEIYKNEETVTHIPQQLFVFILFLIY